MNREFELPSGQKAISFIPDSNERTAAVVDLLTLKRITAMLAVADLNSIKRSLKMRIDNECFELVQLVEVLKDEVAFHETVNLITEYSPVVEQEESNAVPIGY